MELFKLNLRMFDGEGGASTAPTAETSNSGVDVQPTEQNEVAEGNAKTPEDLEAEFENMIKGDYKSFYDKKVQKIVKDRLKGSSETAKKLKSAEKTLSLLGNRYGTSDPEELFEKISSDNSLYEEAALEAGMSTESYMDMNRLRWENQQLKAEQDRQAQIERNNQLFAEWDEKAQEVQKIYPNFNLEAEMQNKDFFDLINAGINMQTAFEVIHHNDTMMALAQQTAAAVQQAQAHNIAIRSQRPSENGLSSQGGIQTKLDVHKMTKEERKALAVRAAKGEKISFS